MRTGDDHTTFTLTPSPRIAATDKTFLCLAAHT
jgi:hypothetical protein